MERRKERERVGERAKRTLEREKKNRRRCRDRRGEKKENINEFRTTNTRN